MARGNHNHQLHINLNKLSMMKWFWCLAALHRKCPVYDYILSWQGNMCICAAHIIIFPWTLYTWWCCLWPLNGRTRACFLQIHFTKGLDTESSGTSPLASLTFSNPGMALAWKDGSWSAMLVMPFSFMNSANSMHLCVVVTTRTSLAVGLGNDRYA